MAPRSNSCGSSFLARRSNLVKARAENKGPPPNVLIIDHDNIDAARLIATLRILFGYDHEIRCTPTLGDAVHRVNERAPDNVFLTEALKPSSDTSQAVTLLRGAGLSGPIIIIGGHMTRAPHYLRCRRRDRQGRYR